MTLFVTQEEGMLLVTEDQHALIVDQRAPVLISAGDQGPPGTSVAGHTHTQSSASDSWTINHNFGYRPTCEVFNSGWAEVEAAVTHTSINQTVVTFTQATTGFARLI